MEQIQPQAGVGAPKHRSGKQELYPESGLFVSSTRLAAIHAEAKKDCLTLFHLLFDEFFTAEECRNVHSVVTIPTFGTGIGTYMFFDTFRYFSK